jgi:hypothetical protein
MDKMSILAAIEEIKKQLAVLEGLVGTAEESVKETSVIEESQVNEQPKELPAPPEVIYVDVDKEAKEDQLIGCQIISELKLNYNGVCDSMTIQKKWYDNTDSGKTEIFRSPSKIVITLLDREDNELLVKTVHVAVLKKWIKFLSARGLYKYKKSDDPHKNGMPHKVNLIVGD